MLPKSLRPLFPYLKKYRHSYIIGTICVFFNNGVWILFPLVLRQAIDDLKHGVTQHKLLIYSLASAGRGRDQGHLPVPHPLDRDRHLARDRV